MGQRLTDLAVAGAAAIRSSFEGYIDERARITRRARRWFEARDWAAGQRDARARLDVRDTAVNACVGAVRAELGGAAHDHTVWRATPASPRRSSTPTCASSRTGSPSTRSRW